MDASDLLDPLGSSTTNHADDDDDDDDDAHSAKSGDLLHLGGATTNSTPKKEGSNNTNNDTPTNQGSSSLGPGSSIASNNTSDNQSNDSDSDSDDSDDDDLDGPSLKRVVQQSCKSYDLGTAIMPKLLLEPDVDEVELVDPSGDGAHDYQQVLPPRTSRYARTLAKEFTAVVIEHHLKWAPLCVAEPGPHPDGHTPITDRLGRYDFGPVDAMVDWALQRGLKVKGHVLVWAVSSPTHFLDRMTPSQVRQQVQQHIFTTMGHFRGRIHVWDVVNEALAPNGTLANNVFLRTMGPTYIEECFHWAHEADPSAILLYNDNKVEGMGLDSPNDMKSEGFYRLLKDLRDRNVPVHGCGMQAHFNAAGVGRNRPPTPRMVKQQIRRLGQLGLRVNISELDVRVSQLPPNLRHIAQRQIYHDICAAALSEPMFDGIWTWGFTDRHTWVTHFYYDDEPLLLDEDYERKEAYYGLRDALASVAPGGVVGGRGVLLDSDVDADGNPWGHLWMTPDVVHDDNDTNHQDAAGDARPDWEQPGEAIS